ncbi:MAG: cytochrome c [Rhodothermales bacterium]|nr:cytochrome c [Rhodothermales bacterium]
MPSIPRLTVQTVIFCALLGSGAIAEIGDIEMGRTIADEYCSRCHNIEPNGPFKQDPPSFAAIAKYRSAQQVKRRIIRPIHEEMPRYLEYMIGGNIDDMVAYIMSLDD